VGANRKIDHPANTSLLGGRAAKSIPAANKTMVYLTNRLRQNKGEPSSRTTWTCGGASAALAACSEPRGRSQIKSKNSPLLPSIGATQTLDLSALGWWIARSAS